MNRKGTENEQINHYAGVCICGVYGARPKP
ncbi:Uncharacterised protein [Haemophilus aegyptius]|nr:Uncharacterised protein [Haemophilus aegyptius]